MGGRHLSWSMIVMAVGFAGCSGAGGPASDPADWQTSWKFDFGPGEVEPGFTQVLPTTAYSDETGFGFNPGVPTDAIYRGGDDRLCGDFCASGYPCLFSVRLPEGNYRVTLTLGDAGGEVCTAVKAESGRLMLEKVRTTTGEFATRTIMVNTRTPRIAAGRRVELFDYERDRGAANWDHLLTLEFNGPRSCVCAMEIAKVDDVPTLYILGDSTVCDHPSAPYSAWGQVLPRFFSADVAVANHAAAAETLAHSLEVGRVAKVLGLLKEGDFVFVQYGHNDMRDEGSDPLGDFRRRLRQLVADVCARGATPVLVAPMERKEGIIEETLGEYAGVFRDLAEEEGVALIDLHRVSQVLYRALGPDLDAVFLDDAHYNDYGAYELAKCVVEGIRQNKLDLAEFIVDDYESFDPRTPDPLAGFAIPVSPVWVPISPVGRQAETK